MTTAPTDPRRGTLRVFLGAAPGVGKTYAMLDEAHRRAERGSDVVVGLVETHGRPGTAAELEGLEVLPRLSLTYRGATFTELDVEAVLRRSPDTVLIDELAHTNVPGSVHAKRWQDVEQVLDAGIDVVTTVNIQHLESLNDQVTYITGIRQQETVPDEVVRRADQIQLVDMSPESLRRRLAHGNVYAPEKIDAALTQYFRIGNLTALRELALLWTADRVDDALVRYRDNHGISEPWPTRERVVVAITGGPESPTLLRRGARIVQRGTGGELMALHVTRSDGLVGAPAAALATHRSLTEQLGGTWHSVMILRRQSSISPAESTRIKSFSERPTGLASRRFSAKVLARRSSEVPGISTFTSSATPMTAGPPHTDFDVEDCHGLVGLVPGSSLLLGRQALHLASTRLGTRVPYPQRLCCISP